MIKDSQRLIADAAHELRTPITTIRGHVELLEKYGAEDAAIFAESTAAIKDAALNLQHLVDDLIFLARVDSGVQIPTFAQVDMAEILKGALDTFRSPRVKLFCISNFRVTGDANLLKKMFAAIIDNALTYSGGQVTVRLKNPAVEIADCGVGISKENLGKIFNCFFKVNYSRTKRGGTSAGLGLTIAKTIAELHRAKITVESELGRGTAFKLTFGA